MNAVIEILTNQTGSQCVCLIVAGIPDAPEIELINGSVIIWGPPANNGRNIIIYVVTINNTE